MEILRGYWEMEVNRKFLYALNHYGKMGGRDKSKTL